MVWLVREIEDISLCIGIENLLYSKNKHVFDAIFNTYRTNNDFPNYVLFSNTLCIVPNCIEKYTCYVCDINQGDWIINLIDFVEEWHANILNCTVFHGSCLLIDGKGVLILGNRKKGKTTLTGYLSIMKGVPYLDEDCVYFFKGKFIGFNMPISVRKNVDNLPSNFIIGTTVDIEKIERELYMSLNTVNMLNQIDIILFPQYNKDNYASQIEIITDYNQIPNLLIKNIRHHKNIETMCKDVVKLSKQAVIMQMNYPNSKTAYNMLRSYINSMN